MGSDVYANIKWDDIRHMIVFHCAPVLAGLKISNMMVTGEQGYRDACVFLKGSNVEIYVLSKIKGKVVLLLINREKLDAYLSIEENTEFLMKMGHEHYDSVSVLRELAKRYVKYQQGEASFPHELGIVLGYPLEDVVGFMRNEGQNYLMSGYWKVYGKAEQAKALFRAYDDATENMLRALISGKSIAPQF